jgi:hypothetical protein
MRNTAASWSLKPKPTLKVHHDPELFEPENPKQEHTVANFLLH